MSDLKRTALYEAHVRAGAKMTPFAGWTMPLNYGSQVAEHQSVRSAAGVFDVSHMTQAEVIGPEAEALLRYLLVGDVARLAPGKGLYSLALDQSAGILDDLLVYRLPASFRIVFNAATRDTLAPWLQSHAAQFQADISICEGLAMLAIQGPDALALAAEATGQSCSDIDSFGIAQFGQWLVARTGYTGEDGVELMLPAADARHLWQRLGELGVRYCGLGARDTLRLEAGLNLYGQDMSADTHPLESRLGWTVAWQPETRDFIGRKRLQEIADQGSARQLTGIELTGKGVMRPGAEVQTSGGPGVVTSGSFSPSLGYSIGLARVPVGVDRQVRVIIRGAPKVASLVSPRFIARTR